MTKEKLGRNGGWYVFADGHIAWFIGLSAAEKRAEIRQHGLVRFFTPDDSRFSAWERANYPERFAKG